MSDEQNDKKRGGRPRDNRRRYQVRTTITLIEGQDNDLIDIFEAHDGKIPPLIKALMRSGSDNYMPVIADDYDPQAALMGAIDDFF